MEFISFHVQYWSCQLIKTSINLFWVAYWSYTNSKGFLSSNMSSFHDLIKWFIKIYFHGNYFSPCSMLYTGHRFIYSGTMSRAEGFMRSAQDGLTRSAWNGLTLSAWQAFTHSCQHRNYLRKTESDKIDFVSPKHNPEETISPNSRGTEKFAFLYP